MAKRFSAREMAILTAPILVIGAMGFWASKRPALLASPTDNGKLLLTFQIDKPTTLEAFDGAQGALVLGLKQQTEQFRINGSSTFIELETPRGPIALRQGFKRPSWGTVWHGNINGTRFPIRISEIPPGVLVFGCNATIDYGSINIGGPLPPKPLPMSGKWKIDRAQLKPPQFSSWQRKPLISLREVKISRIDVGPSYGGRRVSGEAFFHFDGATMNDDTKLEMKVFSFNAAMGHGTNAAWSKTPKKPRQRITEWTVYSLNSKNPIVRVTGRVSADNRWPLGFEIEPFNFKTAKVGQKLRFKQFPVALPKP